MELSLESVKWVWGDVLDGSITDRQWIDNGQMSDRPFQGEGRNVHRAMVALSPWAA